MLERNGILKKMNGREGVIYLPFNPHFFHMVNSNDRIKAVFTVSYLKENEINLDNHKLSYSISCHDDFCSLNKNLSEENRHITTTKKEVLNYDSGQLMTRETCEELLATIGNIEDVRYIVLTCSSSLTGRKHKLSNYSMSFYHFLTKPHLGLSSKVVKPANEGKLVSLAYSITRTLVSNIPDTNNGISIVADAPECNCAMLNVKRPGVLRQYYGFNLEDFKNNTVKRVAYRSHISFKSEGSDPFKLVIKPFDERMTSIARYFHNFLKINKTHLELDKVDLSSMFNSCTVLMYHSLLDIKKESSMGWHCDNKFSLNGNFSNVVNGQTINTPVVIFTIGSSRYLHWRRRYTEIQTNGRKSWKVEADSIQSMLLQEGYMCVINPNDEKPHYDVVSDKEIHFQHGNTKTIADDISVAFVFRVSPHTCVCDMKTNRVILPHDVLSCLSRKEKSGRVKQTDRIKLYEEFDIERYHITLKEHFDSFLFYKEI